MTSLIILTPKRHFLTRKHVVWAIKSEYRSSGSTWARSGEKNTGQNSQKKSQSGNISRIWGETPTVQIRTKICMVGSLPDVITYAKFQAEIFRGYDFTGGRISHVLLIFEWALQQCSANALPVIYLIFDTDDDDDDDDDGVAARRSLPAVPAGFRNEFNSVSRRAARSDASYTPCRAQCNISSGHYDTISDPPTTSQSGNCGQDYQDVDELIKRDPVDHAYLNPVEYGFAAAAAPATCGLPYDLIDTNQTDNGHVYVIPGKPSANQ